MNSRKKRNRSFHRNVFVINCHIFPEAYENGTPVDSSKIEKGMKIIRDQPKSGHAHSNVQPFVVGAQTQ